MESTGWVEVAANLQLLVAGGTLYLAVLNCATWLRLRGDRTLLWLGLWAFSLTALLLANFAVFTVEGDGGFDVALTIRTIALNTAAVLALPFAAALTGRRTPWWLIAVFAALLTARVALWIGTDAVYRHEVIDGTPQYGPLAGGFALPAALVWVAYLLWTVERGRDTDRAERHTIGWGLALTGVILVASLALSEGPVSELLTGYNAVPVALALQLVVLRRLADLHERNRRDAERRAGLVAIGSQALVVAEPETLLLDVVTVARGLLDADRCEAYLGPAGRCVAHDGSPLDPLAPRPAGRLVSTIGLPEEQLGRLIAERARSFDAEDREFLDGVAFVVAASLRRRKSEDEIRHRALHDDLTGLPNRVLLRDRLETALERSARIGSSVAVIFCDLDRFKDVNDVHGHAVGDALLLATAGRLQSAVRSGDTVCRFGGDEFVVVCEDLSVEDTLEIAERMQTALRPPVRIGSLRLQLPASMGVATSLTARDPETLIRDADTAMYRAKENGGGQIEVFEEALRIQLLQRLENERRLTEATRRSEIVVHYQPIVDLDTSSTMRVEALARWQRNRHHLVLPDEWIPLAEETGQIVDVGRTVLREACREVGSWSGLESVGVCVNVSPRQLRDDNFITDIEAALTDRLAPGRLCIEITEQAMMHNGGGAAALLQELRDLGVHVALDDFGRGYSSLSMLASFPFDAIKIDSSFVAQLPDPHATLLVSGIIALATNLGLEVVAEGVERADQAAMLRDLGCRYAQGYLLGRPRAASEVRAAVSSRA